MDIANQSIIISGGASGMGAATAKILQQQGAIVSVLDINQAAIETIQTNLNGLAIQCDITNEKNLEQAFIAIEKRHGAIRGCINCAGVIHSRRIVSKQGMMPLAEFRRIIDINLIGTFNMMRFAAAHMIPLPPLSNSEERGVIINTASIAAMEGQIGQCAYSASKGAIISLMLPAARELAAFGIRVMTIAPGLVDTPMFDHLPAQVKAELTATIPFPKRLAHPEEYARLAQHILENIMLNGETIRLDGALRMQEK